LGFRRGHKGLIVMPDYTVSTFAGSPGSAGNTNDTGTAARFNLPRGVVNDNAGNLYVADFGNHAIRRITREGVVTTFAGSTTGQSGCLNGTGTAARFNGPFDLALVGTSLYVTDSGNHIIRRITVPGGVVTTLTGLSGDPGGTDGNRTVARFNSPAGITSSGTTLYIADRGNHSIRSSTTSTSPMVNTYAGASGMAGDNATSTAPISRANARFNFPTGITGITGSTTLYVTDAGNHMVRKITNSEVTVLAGSAGVQGGFNGIASQSRFRTPVGIVTDTRQNVYVTDSNHVIRKINEPAQALEPTREVINFAGFPGQTGSTNGVTSVARFNTPFGITVINTGTDRGVIYVVDSNNHTIRKLTPLEAEPAPLLCVQTLLSRPQRVYTLRVDEITREQSSQYNNLNNGAVALTCFFMTNETTTEQVSITLSGTTSTSTIGTSIRFAGLDEGTATTRNITVSVDEFNITMTVDMVNLRITFNGSTYTAGSFIPIINLT
jgi:hypothetical protein